MILDPDPELALLRGRADQDLAWLVVVAAAAGDPDDDENPWRVAADRLEAAAPVLRGLNPRTPQGRRRGSGPARDVLAYIDRAEAAVALPRMAADTAERAAKIAERAVGPLRQVAALDRARPSAY